MHFSPILASGEGLLELMAIGACAVGFVAWGITLIAKSKKDVHFFAGAALILGGIMIIVLSLRNFGALMDFIRGR